LLVASLRCLKAKAWSGTETNQKLGNVGAEDIREGKRTKK
jgi:hypothetical protein